MSLLQIRAKINRLTALRDRAFELGDAAHAAGDTDTADEKWAEAYGYDSVINRMKKYLERSA